MAHIKRKCFDCHKNIKTEVNQTVIGLELRWYESYRCPFCNGAAEIDGVGFPPDDIRENMIANEGTFGLSLNNYKVDKIKAMKIIRQIFNYSLSEVSILFNYSDYISTGTKTEMKWVQTILANRDINSITRKTV